MRGGVSRNTSSRELNFQATVRVGPENEQIIVNILDYVDEVSNIFKTISHKIDGNKLGKTSSTDSDGMFGIVAAYHDGILYVCLAASKDGQNIVHNHLKEDPDQKDRIENSKYFQGMAKLVAKNFRADPTKVKVKFVPQLSPLQGTCADYINTSRIGLSGARVGRIQAEENKVCATTFAIHAIASQIKHEAGTAPPVIVGLYEQGNFNSRTANIRNHSDKVFSASCSNCGRIMKTLACAGLKEKELSVTEKFYESFRLPPVNDIFQGKDPHNFTGSSNKPKNR